MNKIHYEVRFRPMNHQAWNVWKSIGTHSTVVEAIKTILSFYEVATHGRQLILKFEKKDELPAQSGDVFWIDDSKESKFINYHFMVALINCPQEPQNFPRATTTYTHPKLRSYVTDWNVVKL